MEQKKRKKNIRVAIIGAGPSGITTAYLLSKNGVLVDVYEREDRVGGLAKSLKLWNQKVDLGPHRFFSKDRAVNTLWKDVVNKDYRLVNRVTKVLNDGKFYFYPIKPFDVLKNTGLVEAFLCVLSYVKEKFLLTKKENTFETITIKKFGKRIYEKFYKGYTEKLWGVPCSDLDADWANQRIKDFSFKEAILSMFGGNKNKHTTLVDLFAYPKKGTGFVYEEMAKSVKKNKGNIYTNTSVNSVVIEKKKVVGIKVKNKVKKYDYVISSMPITDLILNTKNIPQKIRGIAKNLKYRSTILVYLNIDSINLFPYQWVYTHSSNILLGRITNFRNWVKELYEKEKTTILCLEYWCFEDDSFWNKSDKEISDIAKKDIISTKLLKEAKIVNSKVYRIDKAYPVYKKGYKKYLKAVEEYMRGIENLILIGRNGTFKYNNQDHALLMGILASENITDGKNHDLWAVNTGQEYHEAGKVSDTGLEE